MMNGVCDLFDLPTDHSRLIIKDIINKEHLKDYCVKVSEASKKGGNYLGQLYRISITGSKSNGKAEKFDFVLKLSPEDLISRARIPYQKFYRKEVYAYTKILPRFNEIQNEFNILKKNRLITAKCISASSEEFKEFIVLEDLCSQGFVLYDQLKTFDCEHLTLCVKNLAALHALSFVMIEREPQLFKQMVDDACQFEDITEGFQKMLQLAADRTVEVMDDEVCARKLKAYVEEPYEKLCLYLKPEIAAPYNIICHGDCWSNNFLFKYEDNKPVEMRTVDWQIMRYASPVTDIAYLIFNCTDEETRSIHYPAILDVYHETLAERLSAMDCDIEKCYPKQIFIDHVKKILPYGLIMSIVVLPLTQADRDCAPEMIELVKENCEKNNFSKNCIERLRGVIRDFVRYDMI